MRQFIGPRNRGLGPRPAAPFVEQRVVSHQVLFTVNHRAADDVPRPVRVPQRGQRLVVVHRRRGQRRDHHRPGVTAERIFE